MRIAQGRVDAKPLIRTDSERAAVFRNDVDVDVDAVWNEQVLESVRPLNEADVL